MTSTRRVRGTGDAPLVSAAVTVIRIRPHLRLHPLLRSPRHRSRNPAGRAVRRLRCRYELAGFAGGSRIGRYLGMRRSNAARGVRGGQQQLAADVEAFRHLERELVVRCGDYRTAATADGTAGAVQVADVLEGESGSESEGGGVTGQD
jgi:hypothetical protein